MNINELLQWIAIISFFIWIPVSLSRINKALSLIESDMKMQDNTNKKTSAAFEWLVGEWKNLRKGVENEQ